MIRDEASSQQTAATPAGAVKPSKLPRTLAVLFDPRLALWNIALLLFSPILLFMKVRRYGKKHPPQEFSMARWRVDTRLKGEARPHVVFVAASYGEVLLVTRLSQALRQQRPNARITWAIRDPLNLNEIKAKQPDQSLAIQPYDSFYPVAKWLNVVDPDVVVLMERYNFPNLVAASKIWGCKVVLVNGRAKGAYQKVGGLVRSFYKWVFGCYDLLMFQSDDDAQKARTVVRANVPVLQTGNMKMDLVASDIATDRAERVRQWLAPDVSAILAAGSTDELQEDQFVLDAFVKVRRERDCRLLLAPRNLDRPSALKDEIESRGLKVSFRSNMDPPADVHVLDTMGELAYAYSLTAGAYVGGALLGMGH
ncbi:MAG: 3-deoxy-D-manno-octulosonic-acid transferase, partial [Fimbriimonadaceae bacterium]|nr:3-deoxy-D-manno-octulosonic-acid transferase [Fimbriimonadaceae bacterium]